jgi:hypothetical protein
MDSQRRFCVSLTALGSANDFNCLLFIAASMQPQLDHLMWAAAELEAACALFEQRTGVHPQPGGVHPGRGTQNRLVGLGRSQYFEIIAPDPGQSIAGTFGEQFLSLTEPRIHTLMFRSAELEKVQSFYKEAGIASDLVSASRTAPEGSTLRWRLLVPRPNQSGFYVPFFIDWLDAPHPTQKLAGDCTLVGVEISHPDAKKLAAIWGKLGFDLRPMRGPPSIRAILATPKGQVVF